MRTMAGIRNAVEVTMAGRAGPSFLKRQKEQKRVARANAKRTAQQMRRDNKAAGIEDEAAIEDLSPQVDGEDSSPLGEIVDS